MLVIPNPNPNLNTSSSSILLFLAPAPSQGSARLVITPLSIEPLNLCQLVQKSIFHDESQRELSNYSRQQAWYLYLMVTQNVLRTRQGKQVFFVAENGANFRLLSILTNALNRLNYQFQSLRLASISELPFVNHGSRAGVKIAFMLL